ncbi:MAG: cytochrome [Sphingomonas bacterium]|uniref:cytochrome P450 n=1 Tax=Sphingomonas bacterium TaxID=1895847 RepID=UPI00260EEA94|nr:cytochrome P450 [Sphingomonas bacterium]MDB5707743.1 cytochrome [Sphingomonas bacterium]
MADDDINLTNPMFFAAGDPHAIWRRLRTEDPVHWTQGRLRRKFWSITRHADVKFVLMNDHRIFSVQRAGANLPAGPEFENPEDSLFTELTQSGQQLATMDGQPHSVLRRYFSTKFTSSSINGLEGLVRSITEEVLAGILPRGTCDFTTEFAGRIPTAVIAAILGVPCELWDDLYRWNNMLAAPEDPEFSIGTPVETSTAGVSNIMRTCIELAEQKRGKGGDDLLTALTEAEVNGVPLGPTEIGFNGLMFFAAGHETTRASMSIGLAELLRDPAQLAWLRANRHDPKVLRTAAEEFVRYSAPLTHTLRTVTEDVVVGGQEIKAGDWVVLWFHAANRDPAVFAEPERFDVRRSPNDHLGFAVGKHFCLGAHLARLDMAVMLGAVLDHMDDIALAGEVEWASSNLFWGIKHMPIRFTSRALAEPAAPAAAASA